MTKTPGFAGVSRSLLSHCGRREVENRLIIQRSRPRGGQFRGACCPIQAQGLDESAAVPERAAHERRESGKAQPPLREVSQVSKNQVRQKADPDLPLDGVLAIADEVVNLAGLLELLEEGRDSPLSSC